MPSDAAQCRVDFVRDQSVDQPWIGLGEDPAPYSAGMATTVTAVVLAIVAILAVLA